MNDFSGLPLFTGEIVVAEATFDSVAILGDPTLAVRLRAIADKMQKIIDGKREPMTQNYTARRARMKNGQLADADRLEKIQYALYGLADKHDDGTIDPLLTKIKTKAIIETFMSCKEWPNGKWSEDERKRLGKAKLTPDNYDATRAAFMSLINPPDRSEAAAAVELEFRTKELIRQISGYFPTPTELASIVANRASLEYSGLRVLEPSAGAGHIALEIKRLLYPGSTVECCEVNYQLRELLEEQGLTVVAHDFLDYKPGEVYDRVVMNPPFEKGQAYEHVAHAFDLLLPGGRLVSILPLSVFHNSDKKAKDFQDWFGEHGYDRFDNEADAFKESGTGTHTLTIVVDKREV